MKERYRVAKGEDILIADSVRKAMFTITTKKLEGLLNQQDKRIKELEEENEELKIRILKGILDTILKKIGGTN